MPQRVYRENPGAWAERPARAAFRPTQEVEILSGFVGRFRSPGVWRSGATPEQLEEIRKAWGNAAWLHQNYSSAASGQRRYEDKIRERRGKSTPKKAAIRAEDIAKCVSSPVSSLPQREPQKGAQPHENTHLRATETDYLYFLTSRVCQTRKTRTLAGRLSQRLSKCGHPVRPICSI